MKTEDIVRQLQISLPLFTNLINDFATPTSLTVLSDVATIVSTDHGLKTGQKVIVKDSIIPNAISSLTRVNKIATAITAEPHDLSLGFHTTVQIVGATESDYNGTKTLLSITDGNTFKYQLDATPTTPATGSPALNESRVNEGVNGLHTITVVDDNTFTYPTENVPDVTVSGLPLYAAITNPNNLLVGARVSGAVNLQRALDSYTKQSKDKVWLFAVLEARDVSRDRGVNSDSVSQASGGEHIRQRVIFPFTIYAIIPTKDSIGAMRERDMMEDLFIALNKSLLGVRFDSGFTQTEWSSVIATGHDFVDYVGGYYIHRFDYQSQADLTNCDTSRNFNLDRAFRLANLSVNSTSNTDVTDLTVTAKL